MRSVIGVGNFPGVNDKFFSPKGDTLFTITHGATEYVVRANGKVLSPPNATLDYSLTDEMVGVQSGFTGIVRDFLTVDPSMDSPGSGSW